MSKKKVLLVGESWMSSATHYKGFDQFGSVTFHLGAEPLVAALKDSPFDLTYMPAHEAVNGLPSTMEGLSAYDAILLSDIGANSLLLHPDVWLHGKTFPEPAEAAAGLDRRGRRPRDDRRLLQLPGHRRQGALGPHGGRGGAARHLPALRRSAGNSRRVQGRRRGPRRPPDPGRASAPTGRFCSAPTRSC